MRILTSAVAALPLLAPFVMAQNQTDPNRLLTDFATIGESLEWHSVNDGVMGGRSSGTFRVADGRLEFSGSLNTDGGGFASIRTGSTQLSLDGSEGVRLRARGDGRVYTMRLEQAAGRGRRATSYRATFRTAGGTGWQQVWLPFDTFVPMWRGRTLDLPPIDVSRIAGLGLMIADKIDGPFRIEVDSIGAYAPFSIDSLHGSHRPLIAFAPSTDDPRLAEQRAAVVASAEEFRERDMVFIEVVERGESRVDDRPLSRDSARELRRRFAVADGEFVMTLVGKDGAVKRNETAAMPLTAVYAQIDEMPMRRAEIAERRER